MRMLILFGILMTTILLGCGLMPPRRQYIKEAKRQIIPKELLNSRWALESWDNKTPDCRLMMSFYEKGRFTFSWNVLDFKGDNLWYIVKDSAITFQTRPIEKMVWTTEKYELEPDNFALDLSGITNYKLDSDRLILSSTHRTFVFKRN